jgi:hypothetical protein
VSLGRLALAWLAVAAWFVIAGWAGRRMANAAAPVELALQPWAAGVTLAEAAVVTLFAALWFGSLGSGGWWLLFLLVGALVAFPVRLQALLTSGASRRAVILLGLVDLARYVGAGAILAWRLR